MKKLQIVVMNGCLRETDSRMLSDVVPGDPIIFVLAAIGGPSKQHFDRCMAHRLGVPIVHITPTNIKKLRIPTTTECVLYRQNMEETAGFSEQLCGMCTVKEVRQYEDNLAVPFQQFSPVFGLFYERVKELVEQPIGQCLPARPAFKHIWVPSGLKKSIVLQCTDAPTSMLPGKGCCYPSVKECFQAFKELVEPNYGKSREHFGGLFDYDPPSSSFMSPYLAAGAAPIRVLFKLARDVSFRRELIWNQFCICFGKHFGKSALQEYGPYNRKRTWLSAEKQRALYNQLLESNTSEPLINAVMNQLKRTGFIPNRLRMVFASWLSQQGLPWKLSASLFENFLVDFDFRSNTFNWLFSYNLTAGNPHTFSIQRQIKKFDPRNTYIQKWGNPDRKP